MSASAWDLLVAAPILAPLVGVALASDSGLRHSPRLSRALPLAASALNLACAASLFVQVLATGPRALTFGGWLTAVRGDGPPVGDLAPSLIADAATASLVLALALALTAITARRLSSPSPDGPTPNDPGLPLVALGAQAACLAGDLATQLVGLELMHLGAALAACKGAPEAALRRILTRSSVMTAAVALLGLTTVVALTGTTRLAALPEVIGQLPPASRDVAQAALLAVFVATLQRAAVTPLGGWLHAVARAESPCVRALAPVLAVAGFAALARLHHPLTAGLDAAVAAGCEPCRDLRLEHLDGLLLPLGATGSALAALAALRARTLSEVSGWLIASGLAVALVALSLPTQAPLPGPAAAATLQLLGIALAGPALLLAVSPGTAPSQATASPAAHGPGDAPQSSGQPATMAPFAVSSVALLGLPPLSGFAVQLTCWRALRDTDGGLVAICALALSMVLMTVAVARAASLHLWRTQPATAPSRLPPLPGRLALGALTAALLALTATAGPLLARLSAGGPP